MPQKILNNIDEELYSRQLYVLGHSAMQRMQQSNVLIVGLNGLGVEIAKNVILGGVKAVYLYDETVVSLNDLSSQYYLNENQVGKVKRSEGCIEHLKSLNRYVQVIPLQETYNEKLFEKYKFDVIIHVNQNIKNSIKIDNFCRGKNIKFISADLFGLFGGIFVDNGLGFVVSDTDGKEPEQGIVAAISNDGEGLVTVSDEKRHNLETGDYVRFAEVEGMKGLNGAVRQIRVLGPFSFSIESTDGLGVYTGGGIFTQVKSAAKIDFKSLEESLKNPEFVLTDFAKIGRSEQLLALHRALNDFQTRKGRLPAAGTSVGLEESIKIGDHAAELCCKSGIPEKEIKREILSAFARGSSAVIAPMASVLGGIAAQEVMKAVSGKFMPIRQHLYFDCEEFLQPKAKLCNFASKMSRYDDSIALFGSELIEKIKNYKLFLIGAGAIGCELLKNWAMLGLACGPEGKITVTDMDSIEKSNLNRQFLFRDKDVSKLKSACAADAVKEMNSDIQIDSQSNRVGKDTEEIYNDDFWEGQDLICSALDNVETRLYVDSRCVYYQKPLFESGTLGTKGNTQVVVPHLTESYSSSRDPPEKSVPMCTLKNFPNKIEHTIQWARDLFEGLFKQAAEEANCYVENDGYIDQLLENSSTLTETIKNIQSILSKDKPFSYEDCIRWARKLFENLFSIKIKELLFAFPIDHKTSSGSKFWSGPKRAPSFVEFNINDRTHLDFIKSAARLRAFIFKIPLPSEITPKIIAAALESCDIPIFSPNKNLKIATTDEELEEQSNPGGSLEPEEMLRSLPPREGQPKLTPIEFEKDDSANGHMDFVVACANLRARNYSIEEVSLHQCKLIAGKIIPAIATTTSIVSGMVCLEMLKYAMNAPLEKYKNAFINLAIPFIAFSEPVSPPKIKSLMKGKPCEFTLWDTLLVDQGDITLNQFLKYFEEKLCLKIQMLTCNPSIIYSCYFRCDDIDKKLSQLVADSTKKAPRNDEKYIIFEASVSDKNGNDVEIPTIRFKFRN